MAILKKDLYLVMTKYYFPIVLYLMILLITRDYIGIGKVADNLTLPSNIMLLKSSVTFSLSNIAFIYVFLGARIPTKLFESESSLKDHLYNTPVNNSLFLWSKIAATALVMLPFLAISLFMLDCFSFGTLLVTLLLGLIVISIVAISSFIEHKVMSILSNIFVTVSILLITLTKNTLVMGFNKQVSDHLVKGALPSSLVIKLLMAFFVVGVSVTCLYGLVIKRRKING